MAEQTNEPKYPHLTIELSGKDGNVFFILGRMSALLRTAGLSQEELDEFIKEATSKDYDHVLQTCMKWVNVK